MSELEMNAAEQNVPEAAQTQEQKEPTLLEKWRTLAYGQRRDKKGEKLFWDPYFEKEKAVYEQLLENPEAVVSGTVRELAERFDIETMDEDTTVSLGFDTALLYKNMVDAKADWLYGLPQWEKIFSEEKRKELFWEQKKSGTIVKPAKVGRNDPCPCGSGKKYKYCCGRA